MQNKSTQYTEQKVLQMAACQGVFTIDRQASGSEDRQSIATTLATRGYLKHISVDKQIITYTITESGKEYLKVLNGVVPKHREVNETLELVDTASTGTTSTATAKGVALESVLIKRLNILRNANKRGLEFNLTDANVRSLLNKKVCYYTGVSFDSLDPLDVRTFERVDDTKGYIQGNVVAVTLRANRIKNILLEQDGEYKINVEQFISMAEKIKKHTT